jgi:hypothetical protein
MWPAEPPDMEALAAEPWRRTRCRRWRAIAELRRSISLPRKSTAIPQTLDEASTQIMRSAAAVSRLRSLFERKEPEKFAYATKD